MATCIPRVDGLSTDPWVGVSHVGPCATLTDAFAQAKHVTSRLVHFEAYQIP